MALTIKQEKFCMVYIETGNASEAYRQAYNSENMKPETIVVKASELLKSGNVTVRIEELRKKHAKRHAKTIDDLVADLEKIKEIALGLENPQCSAAVNSVMSTARLLGFLDKKEEGNKDDIVSVLSKLIDKLPN